MHLTLNDTFSADGAEGLGAQAAKTGAVLDIVDVGLVSLDLARDAAHVNRSAAALLKYPEGFTTASAFSEVIRALARRALNQADVAVALRRLKHDSLAELRTTWLFADAPTHLGVVSKPAPDISAEGRIWAFYDNSALAQAIEASNQANDLLRATSDAMLDAQALLEGVWADGQIVDFIFRDVNPAACEYLGLTEDNLVGRSLLKTMPNIGRSGLLARYAHCAVTGEPLIADDVLYDNELLDGPRRYDIRGTHVRGDLISLTWRDVTERSELVQRITASEEQFRLLAENMADVVVRLDDDGVITWISKSVERALGAPPELWIGRHAMEFAIPGEFAAARERLDKVIASGADIGRALIRGADGAEHYIHLHSNPFYDADGNRDGVVASFRVIDDEVAAEERAQGLLSQRDTQNRSLTRRLQSQTERLTAELDSAARYVASILPGYLAGPVEVSARYVPSRELGGDSYDYRWIDDDHLIFYLVDVSGHGVEPAMLSVSVHNLMRSGTFDRTMLLEPDWVLTELNRMFPMEQQYGHFFTIWYGVYEASSRTLRFSSAGHPPALALSGGGSPAQLSTPGLPIGVSEEDADFTTSSYQVPPGADILLYSDGAFELDLPDGRVWSLPQFVDVLAETATSAGWTLDDLVERLRERSESGLFDDDCTLVRLSFP